uniref:Uncharacterized protein n=1 Tax=Chromera velia CCMP2878 TaxID=1169474 RepID=A0A0G4HTC6_9ALVE|eukprot:Cvel_8444.t1-p1 / transcript=Cvel_8444.t1 / gene=Cvel_8444 / organism=Chromera_velia_CCMP2878 / gene_product=hypothetical protein / transcript_product=hypothetical protein / location=Cvel_scaffold466:38577-39191(+) / protein_length=205 / sequence_SO=supercontig / SO=protein_coding / is_pseudo=false
MVQDRILRTRWDWGVELARHLSSSLSFTAVKLVYTGATESTKQAIFLLKQWRLSMKKKQKHMRMHALKPFVLELLALRAYQDLKEHRRPFAKPRCHKIFMRALELLDVTEVTWEDPCVIDFEFLQLYAPADWQGIAFDCAHVEAHCRLPLHIVNPFTPNLDVLQGIHRRVVYKWARLANHTLQRLEDPTTTAEEMFGEFWVGQVV